MLRSWIYCACALVLCGGSWATAQDHVTKNLELVQPATGNSVIIAPAASTVNMVLTLPDSVPSALAAGKALTVQGINSTVVTTGWQSVTPSGAANGVFIVKQSNQSTTSTTASDVSDLTFDVAANTAYYFESMIRVSETAGTQLVAAEILFDLPSGSTASYYYNCANQFTIPNNTTSGYIPRDNTADCFGGFTEAVAAPLIVDGATIRAYNLKGVIYTGNTAGTFKLQFRRQNGTSSNEVTIHQYSFIKVNTL